MSWPTPQDYNEAIQNPRYCFSDAELRAGKPELDRLGLPKPISGNFASVYQVTSGVRRWAVRCFLREIPDHQRRYRAISEHLRSSALPFVVAFEFLPNGIRVDGMWYPILKMEWVDGDPLHVFIERNLGQPAVLQPLIKQWIGILSSLRRASIAHGDLQHGNILISQGQIRLIDYDGMFVPSLAGWPSHEEGHRNYQHPARTGRDFGPNLDAFPGWVIVASLAVLSMEPRFWRLLNGGDECLLFRRADFENPAASKAFQAIHSSGHFELQTLMRHIASLVALPLNQIPSADSSKPLISLAPSVQPSGLPDWLKNSPQVGELPSLPALTVNLAPLAFQEHGGPAWLIDHLAESHPPVNLWINVAFGPQRAMLILDTISLALVMMITAYGMVPFWFAGLLVTLLAIGTGTVLMAGFRGLPRQSDKRAARANVDAASQEVTDLERSIEVVQQGLIRFAEPALHIQQQYQELPQRLQHAIGVLQHRYREALDAHKRERQRLDAEEAKKLQSIDGGSQRQTAGLIQEKNRLDSQQQHDLTEALRRMRQEHIQAWMRRHFIAGARLRGIGATLTERLAAEGVCTAADVTSRSVRHVYGIGEAKASQLKAWAASLKRYAESSAPAVLPSITAHAIAVKYTQTRRQLDAQIEAMQRRITVERQHVLDEYSGKRRQIHGRREPIDSAYRTDRQEVQRQVDQDKERFQKEFGCLKAEFDKRRRVAAMQHEELSRTLLAKRIGLTKARRELKQYQRLTLGEYLRHVLRLS